MSSLYHRCIVSLSVLGALGNCTGTDVGNGVVDVDFALYDSSNGSSAKERSSAAPDGLMVSEAWVAVERVRLRAADNCDGDTENEFVGPFAVDMLAPGTSPMLSALDVQATRFCRFELRWDAGDELPPDVPAELIDASLLLLGTRQDGTAFVLRSERGDEMRLDARNGAFVLREPDSALFLAFDVQDLFDGVDVDAAEVGAGNVIRIEPGSNEELLAVFDDNVEQFAKLFDDKDGDRELDPEERDGTDVLAE